MNLVIKAAVGLALLSAAGIASAEHNSHRNDHYGNRGGYGSRSGYGDRCGDYSYYDPHYAHELNRLNEHLEDEYRAFREHDRYENDPYDARHRENDYRAFQQHRREEIQRFREHQAYDHGRGW